MQAHPMADPVVICLTTSAGPVAERVAGCLGGTVQHPARGEVMAHIQAQFAAGRPVVGICAAGILVRALAPVLVDKRDEPPVLSVAEDGSAVVPLLGGHRGANDLARKVAAELGCVPAITTAGDLRLGVALDEPPPGWRLENPSDAKAAMAALLAGAGAVLSGEADWLDPLGPALLRQSAPPDAPVVLSVEGTEPLVYRRQTLALGVGAARDCPPEDLLGLAQRALAEAGRSVFEVASVSSLDLKADEPAVLALGDTLGVPVGFFDAARLELETPRLANPSEVVFGEVGCHGVAEAAALAAAGPGSVLSIEKAKSSMATVAAADFGPDPRPGRPRGHLGVIGIGPGNASWRTPEASQLVAGADVLVGYGLYLDLLGPLAAGKPRADFPLGGEEARCRHALELAGTGQRVALICSGDGGIYAMGALVMELLDRGDLSDGAMRVAVTMAPGISALQAASARTGALLGHDFCTISLSDLLTPRADIERRIRAAAEGDFVIAFYNPVSQRRRTLLSIARDVLLRHRPADAPVLLARNLGRPEEALTLRSLATLDVDEVDMLTVVLVGASQSRVVKRGDSRAAVGGSWIYTPRGYAAKMSATDAAGPQETVT